LPAYIEVLRDKCDGVTKDLIASINKVSKDGHLWMQKVLTTTQAEFKPSEPNDRRMPIDSV